MRRQRAGRPDPRPPVRPGGRAHPGLQHGLPPRALPGAIGGFDPQFRTAGDDVDVCWRLQRARVDARLPRRAPWSGTTGATRCAPTGSSRAGYGRAEALLERKWPEKYNGAGHVRLGGTALRPGLAQAISWRRERIYQGTWGSCPVPVAVPAGAGHPSPSLPLMPEWYLAVLILALLSALGAAWPPLLLALPFLGLAAGALVLQAGAERGARALRWSRPLVRHATQALRADRAPVPHAARGAAPRAGSLHGLTPWRRRGAGRPGLPWPRTQGPLAAARAGRRPSTWRTSARHSGMRERLSARAAISIGGTSRFGLACSARCGSSWPRKSTAPAVSSCDSGSGHGYRPRGWPSSPSASPEGAGAAASQAWMVGPDPGDRRESCADAGADRQRPGRRGRPRTRWTRPRSRSPRRMRSTPGRRPSSGRPDA